MKKRKTKFFSLILSLILVLVSVPMSVVSDEITDVQGDLSITQPSDELVEQTSFDEITDIQSNLDVTVSNDELVVEELPNETATTTTSDSQLVTGIPDGIYAIEIAGLSSYYISYSTTSTYASCNSTTISPTLMGMPAYLFKVTQVPDTDRYIIRSMVDQTQTLKAYAGYVVWATIPEDDSQVPEDNTFNIIDNNGAYLIKDVGTRNYICSSNGNVLVGTNSYETQYLNSWRFRGYRSYIEDGVYSFENVGNSNMWSSTQNDSYEAGANIQQKSYDGCPIDSFSRGGMFKINRIGNTDQYTIRLMTNNLLAWSLENSNIVVRDLPQNESEIPDSMKFYIAYDAESYIIIPYISNGIYMTPISTASDSDNLTILSAFTISNTSRWKLNKYTGQPQHGIDIVDSYDFMSNGAMVGETYIFKAICWSTDLNIHDYFLALPSQYNNAATLNWNSTEKTASFTATEFIDIGINVGCYTATNSFLTIYIKDPIMFNTIRQEETVYLQNSGSEKYSSVAGTLIPGGGDVGQYTYSDSPDLKWIIERDSDNIQYVRFKSLANGKYLGVDLSNPTRIYQYDSKGDNTFWKIVSTESGSTQIISKVYESSGRSLSIPMQSMLEGEPLVCNQYTNDTDYSDEWNLVTQVLSYVNYYDTSIAGDTSKISNISKANSFANSVYSRYFGVGMHRDGYATYYHTTADDCPLGNSACTVEDCGENCYQSHHKNVDAIYDQLYNSDREDDHIYVLWTDRGYTYCEGTSANHISTRQTLAFARDYNPVIQFLVIYDSSPELIEAFMGITLVHETAHTFRMPDVYDDEEHMNKVGLCVMDKLDSNEYSDFYNNIVLRKTSPFCDLCMEKMLAYTSNINIEGNQGGN